MTAINERTYVVGWRYGDLAYVYVTVVEADSRTQAIEKVRNRGSGLWGGRIPLWVSLGSEGELKIGTPANLVRENEPTPPTVRFTITDELLVVETKETP